MDSILLRNLSVRGKHGVGERERSVEQEFLIDIDAEFDASAAAKSDDIKDTLNYSTFRAVAKDVVEKNSFYLVEKLAQAIATRILEDARIHKVAVSVRKPSVYSDAVPGIRIERTRV